MVIKCIPTGMFGSNSYIVGDNKEAVVIDAGVSAEEIIKAAEAEGLKLKYVLLTHGHIDHIASIDRLRSASGIQALIHEQDADAVTNPVLNGSALFGTAKTFNPADRLLKGGELVEAGGIGFEIIHTPGHSPGCICIKAGNNIFTGDTLFKLSIGRTDLGKGNYEDIIASITQKLSALDDSTVVYPGHGSSTTIGYEKKNNPFIR
ncbi:MAG: MBL fold metallo-hydrolase [Clostridia bacterium]|nr:MBL fold metallo-hydrolase [Clostridia bacterium]